MDFIENSDKIEDDCDVISQTPDPKLKKHKVLSYEHTNDEFCHTSRNKTNYFSKKLCNEEAGHSNEIQPFIYVSFDRLKSYNENVPINNNVHIIGRCKRANNVDYYLNDVLEVHGSVELNFIPQLVKLPENNQHVSVYGHLLFNSDTLKVVVKFWKNIMGDVYEYMKLLELQTKFVPASYYEVSKNCDFSVLEENTFCEKQSIVRELHLQ
ncbi:unnamed protein product [Brassicogethes aeneus]|uniref:Uncharacterized protein n=1 Tax=Brassicogethes aeneus TaxID=1431903 RepID=A0A9P0FGV6_BRAAE|nr:unnamed protein product [Brassicogethes aeneus]